MRTSDMKMLIKDSEFKIAKQAGDEGSNTKGYLLPRYQHKDKFIVRRVPKSWLNQN